MLCTPKVGQTFGGAYQKTFSFLEIFLKTKKVQNICTFLSYITEKRSGGDTLDKEERQVVVNGKPILEQLSKEEADAFYVVLLLQVQNMYMKKQAEGRKGFQV